MKLAAKQAVATVKSHHYQELYDQLDMPGGVSNMYRLAKSRHRSAQYISHVMQVKRADNQVLRNPPSILHRWSVYFSGICKEEFPHPQIPSPPPTLGPVPRISIAEVKLGIEKMKRGKATD
ncbi:RNA-directed DNA polymerase from mobile element jockey-like protein [Labeo rohita]|uniref:RNA-directed DNA polymerase from mobile element jockey-like protein n=1 Tax=Labeo rohita TaxID=84645 RepID=A0A498LTB7_LABRO|nr:RNA-directed DNA polymerase from mobile element jockey-like protein [Labeo rohita]